MTVPAGAIKVFEHSGLLAPGVFLGEILENAPFACASTAPAKLLVYLVLRYEAVDLRHALYVRRELAPFKPL